MRVGTLSTEWCGIPITANTTLAKICDRHKGVTKGVTRYKTTKSRYINMELKVVVPTELNEIPLVTYQKWLEVSEQSNDQEFLAHKFVQLFLGLELKDAMKVARNDINRMVSKIESVLTKKPKFKQTFKFRGYEFGFIPNLDRISWGEYIDIESNLMDWSTIHIALSVLYRPIKRKVKDTYEIVEYEADESFHDMFKYVPLDIALGSSVFFCNLEKELLSSTTSSLNQLMKNKTDLTTLVNELSLTNNGVGITHYIDSLKAMLEGLTKYQNYPSIKHLPFSPTKSKKTRLSTMNINDE